MKFKLSLYVAFIFLISSFSVYGQTLTYRNLVLEGGGIRGIAYGGALAELEQQGILSNITRVGGTSAGAIQAALLAVGYSPQEITEITFKTPIQQFSDGRLFFLGGFTRLTKQFGWYRGEKFQKWIAKLVYQKTGNADLTFAQLHALVGKQNYRDLYVLGTNLSAQKVVILSHETYPDMKICDAVRISMSIPLYFRAVFVDKQGNIVKKDKHRTDLEVMVDGGILANFPIDLFDHSRYASSPTISSQNKVIFNRETLGIRLDTDAQIQYDLRNAGLAPLEINNLNDYMRAFYAIIIEQLNRQRLKSEDWERTISVSTKGYGERIRRLSEKDKTILLESGRQGVQLFLNNQSQTKK